MPLNKLNQTKKILNIYFGASNVVLKKKIAGFPAYF